MKRNQWLAASVVIVIGLLMTAAPSQAQIDEDCGQCYKDPLYFGLRGMWAQYLTQKWQHKEKVVTAYFTGDDSLLVVLKPAAKSQEAELRKAIAQSYEKRVLRNKLADSWFEFSYGMLPTYVRIFIQYKR